MRAKMWIVNCHVNHSANIKTVPNCNKILYQIKINIKTSICNCTKYTQQYTIKDLSIQEHEFSVRLVNVPKSHDLLRRVA